MKFSRVKTCHPAKCPAGLYNQFYKYNFGSMGLMRGQLVDSKNDPRARIFYIVDEFSSIAAWSLTFDHNISGSRNNGKPEPRTYFYVRKNYRRMGLGTRLARAAYKYSKGAFKLTLRYMPHDDKSKAFFEYCRKKKIAHKRGIR